MLSSFYKTREVKYIAVHHPVGGMLVDRRTSRANDTLPSDKRPQVPNAVQLRGRKAMKEIPSCSMEAGYPRPAYGQVTVTGKGK